MTKRIILDNPFEKKSHHSKTKERIIINGQINPYYYSKIYYLNSY